MKTKEKNILSYELSKTQESDRMKGYYMKHTATLAILPTGEIIPVDKEHIENRFCFGESGYDAEEAHAACRRAWNDEQYFINENMKSYRKYIDDLKECLSSKSKYYCVTVGVMLEDQADDCKLRWFDITATWRIIENLGGSAYLDDLPGKVAFRTPAGHPVRVATKDEIQAIINAYEEAARQHETKLRAYLKRYGLSQVRAWTYWRDE